MNCATKVIEYQSRADVFRIHGLGDTHVGDAACCEKRLEGTITEIQEDPQAYWIGVGDYSNWINRQDPRFDPGSLPKWLIPHLKDLARGERERIVEILKPVGSKCLVLLKGNHEESIERHSERNVYQDVAEGIGAQNVCLGYSGFLRLVFRRQPSEKRSGDVWTVVFFMTHGWWGGRLMGNGALNLERVAGQVEADVIMAGHDHRRRAFVVDRFACDRGNNIVYPQQWAMSCGTYLGAAAYAERSGYRPSDVGSVVIEITPDKKQINVRL